MEDDLVARRNLRSRYKPGLRAGPSTMRPSVADAWNVRLSGLTSPIGRAPAFNDVGSNHSYRFSNSMSEDDLRHLHRAIALALQARACGRHPFGALVVLADGEVLAEAINATGWPDGEAIGHAELVALREASRRNPRQRLALATLYSSAEPCAMCAGAVYWSGISRVVYALSEVRLLKLTGNHPENPTLALPCRELFARGQRRIEVIGPALEDEAAAAHASFWT